MSSFSARASHFCTLFRGGDDVSWDVAVEVPGVVDDLKRL